MTVGGEPRNETTRPVWLTETHAQRFVNIALKLHQMGQHEDASFLMDLSEAVDAAPADPAGPHGVIRVAITNAYYDARNAGETMETAANNARDGVLTALGYPGCPSQETPT